MHRIKVIVVFLLMMFFSLPSFAQEDIRDTKSPYGILSFLVWDQDWNNYHYGSDTDIERAIELLSELGIAMVRLDFTHADLEPSQDVFDFKKHDYIVERLQAKGIKVLGMLQYNAPWTGRAWNEPPEINTFVNYATKVASHYKGQIKYWEIWNEPNFEGYWNRQDDMVHYVELLKSVYPKLKDVDSSFQIVLGGLTGKISVSLDQIYQNGGKDYFDIANIHPFENYKEKHALNRLKSNYKKIREVMANHDDLQKKVWITEIGTPGVIKGQPAPSWWFGKPTTEEEQAEWLSQIYKEVLALEGVEKIFWAFFRDTRHFYDAIDYFGIIRKDFSKKKAFYEYQKIIQEYSEEKSH